MIEFVNVILINKPVSEVFGFLANLENLPKWNYYVLQVRLISGEGSKAGATYHQVRKTDEEDLHLEEVEPNRKIVVKTMPPSPVMLEMTFNLEEQAGSTVVRDTWMLDSGRPTILELLGRGVIKSAAAQNLGKLKTLLETGEVTLQDSRIASI